MNKIKNFYTIYLTGVLNSYSQIFFSNNKLFGFILLLVSFINPIAGLAGLCGIVVTQILAVSFNFNKQNIANGLYTYNTLLVCLGIGSMFDFNLHTFALIVIASILTFLITIKLLTIFSKYSLPILSIPFLIGIWLVILGADNFTAFKNSNSTDYALTHLFPELFNKISGFINNLPSNNIYQIYLRSMGAIFFQYNDFAGLIIATSLLLVSRISFLSSFIGFLVGFLFYKYFQGDFSHLIYSHIGFNFILTAIALNGFFIVANRKSFILYILVIPVIALLNASLYKLFNYFYLPIYSLPFNISVILIIASLQARNFVKDVYLVQNQLYSAEKNHYEFFHNLERFKAQTFLDIQLPFMGFWHVSQGHNGKITHLEDWQYAWDFDITDEKNKTYKNLGTSLTDFYCYGLPVCAPANGYIYSFTNETDDNKIGEVNIEKNWGNTIIIKHSDYLYSALSHLKKDSMIYPVGAYVNKGDIIAYCGNSGRSPEPHLHFQLQATPYIGSKTIKYPISHYVVLQNGKYQIKFYDIPQENEIVSNLVINPAIYKAFNLTPGQKIVGTYECKNKTRKFEWEVFTDAYNRTYIFCHNTKSVAYFVNNGSVFYFTAYYGKKTSILFDFYLACQKVVLGYYPDNVIKESLMILGHFNYLIQFIHDLTTQLFHYLFVDYVSYFDNQTNQDDSTLFTLKSEIISRILNFKVNQKTYKILISQKGLSNLLIEKNRKNIKVNFLVEE